MSTITTSYLEIGDTITVGKILVRVADKYRNIIGLEVVVLYYTDRVGVFAVLSDHGLSAWEATKA